MMQEQSNKKINVLYISHDAGVSGAPLSLLDMLSEIRLFVNAYVVLPKENFLAEKLKGMNIPYYVVPFMNAYAPLNENEKKKRSIERNNSDSSIEIGKIAQELDIDIIHSNSSVVDAGVMAALRAHIPHVWHIREFMEEDMRYVYCCDREIKKELFDRSRNIVISDAVRKSFNSKWDSDAVKIYDGISTERFKYEKHTAKTLNILIIGSVSEGKGQIDVIRACAELVHRGHDPHIYIIGDDEGLYADVLKLYASRKNIFQRIVFAGEISNPESFIKSMDMAVMSSRCEALGRVTIEYMAAGIPVVGARSGGTVELIGENEERGYFYEPGNASSLADAVIRCHSDSDRDNRIQAAKRFVDEEFSTALYAKKIYQIYLETLEGFEKNIQCDAVLLYSIEQYVKKEEKKEEIQFALNPDYLTNKYREMMRVSFRLLKAKTSHFEFKRYLKLRGIQNVAIYGLANIGRYILFELIDSEMDLRYVIDKSETVDCVETLGISHFYPEDELPKVDAIIVTVFDSEGVINSLMEKGITDRVIDIFTESKKIIRRLSYDYR